MYYLHIDCNSYFASCEVATRKGMEGKPLVVANENENGGGVILALTAEAKALGLVRGTPLFKVRSILNDNKVVVCKADHAKYKRISRTIMEAVREQGIVLNFVQYSIDEFFGTLPLEDPEKVRHYVRKVMDLIWATAHIPVGCGCSQTYTLSKVATHFAKRHKGYKGICVLPVEKRERALALLAVGDVWGVGRQNRKHLEAMGVRTALDFARLPQEQVVKVLNTAGVRTWQELRGTPAITIASHERQKSIMQSHTFAVMIREKEALSAEVRAFASRCAATLRRQGSLCTTVTVFVATNRYRDDLWQYRNHATLRLPRPLSDTPTILQAASDLLSGLYRQGYHYKQAGVILGGIMPDEGHQLDLFTVEADERRRRVQDLADRLNIHFASDLSPSAPLSSESEEIPEEFLDINPEN